MTAILAALPLAMGPGPNYTVATIVAIAIVAVAAVAASIALKK